MCAPHPGGQALIDGVQGRERVPIAEKNGREELTYGDLGEEPGDRKIEAAILVVKPVCKVLTDWEFEAMACADWRV